LVDEAKQDINSSADELEQILASDLEREAILLYGGLDRQQESSLKQLENSGQLNPQNVILITRKYTQERDRLKVELMSKAEKYSILIFKIRNGGMAIDAVERMDVFRDQAQHDLIMGIITEDIPKAIATAYLMEKMTSVIGKLNNAESASVPAPAPSSNVTNINLGAPTGLPALP
jgi:hypothetical protein